MSNAITSFWEKAGRGARTLALGSVLMVLSLTIWGVFALLHEEYGVLFSDLSAADAGAIVEQLKQDKVPYRLGADGTLITVPAERVHEERLRLMSRDLPLSGGVGFEIFDKQGLGATEQTQRVSFQRALQGELARTIGALEQVKQVRVHLVLPESTLFTRDRQRASAAVNLTMRLGVQLTQAEIAGLQRLVAAAVPGLEPARVVITDQRGVTLSMGDADGVGAGAADARLQFKRAIEEYMTQKIVRLLDSAYGPGQAIVSVDTTLNFNASKTIVQDLLPASGDSASQGEGRLVRKRQVLGGSTNEPQWTATAAVNADAPPARQQSSSMEVEYEYGKRIDEVIAAPGAVSRISVGVIVPGALNDEKRDRIAELVRMAAGVNEARGDAISVQALDQVASDDATPSLAFTSPRGVDSLASAHNSDNSQGLAGKQDFDGARASGRAQDIGALWEALLARRLSPEQLRVMGVAVAVLLVAGVVAAFAARRRLSDSARQRILAEVQRALREDLRT